jgi:DNA-binding IclR family transcriptional regulator
LDILEFIAKNPDQAKSLGDIADSLGLNAGTCANIIKTMADRKYIEQSSKRKGYILGPNAYRLTGNDGYKKDLIEASKQEMQFLVEKFNENALLAVLDKDLRSIVYTANSDQELQASARSDKRAYDSSTGRILISMLGDDELKKFVEKYGLPRDAEWEGVSDFESLTRQLKQIRNDGLAIQISVNQIIGLAVPIYKHAKVVASLSIYMPSLRFNSSNQKTLSDCLVDTGKKISKKLSK